MFFCIWDACENSWEFWDWDLTTNSCDFFSRLAYSALDFYKRFMGSFFNILLKAANIKGIYRNRV